MNIPKLIPICYDIAIKRGQYRVCPICGGDGVEIMPDVAETKINCRACNGSGIDPNIPISELLMRVIEEIGEANKAWREHNLWERKSTVSLEDITHDMKSDYPPVSRMFVETFEEHIKDTFEQELADILITLLSICGYLGIEHKKSYVDLFPKATTCAGLYSVVEMISKQMHFKKGSNDIKAIRLSMAIDGILLICKQKNIPIEKHVLAKIEYNKTRI
jgi:NTP pyrophosphatase (non-canonical NTP hydrolase)